MKTIEIELTNLEYQVFGLIAADPKEWVQNVARERCRVATDQIVNVAVQKCLAENLQIPSTKEEIVALAIEKKWVGDNAQ